MARKVWALTDHLCGRCSGRVLQCVAGQSPTGGGNPIFMCADCEASSAAMGPEAICWCGKDYRGGANMGLRCVRTDDKRLQAVYWAKYGVDPSRHRIGVMSEADLIEALSEGK